MLKSVLAGTVALAVAGSTLAYAQNRPDGARRFQPTLEDMRAFGDARIAGLKAGLVLNVEQEKNWPAFEQAARDFQQLRLDRLSAGIEARRSGQPRTTNPADMMQRRAAALADTSSAMKKMADATGPLYTSLDDNQKRRFGILSRMGAEAGSGRPMMRDGFGSRFRRTDDRGSDERGNYERGNYDHGMHGGPGAQPRALMQPIRGEEDL